MTSDNTPLTNKVARALDTFQAYLRAKSEANRVWLDYKFLRATDTAANQAQLKASRARMAHIEAINVSKGWSSHHPALPLVVPGHTLGLIAHAHICDGSVVVRTMRGLTMRQVRRRAERWVNTCQRES